MIEMINGKAYVKKGDKVYEVGGGGSGGGTGTVSWNDLTDKPFGDESVTIEWDGSTDGKVTNTAGPDLLVKISDLTPEQSELVGAVLTIDGETMTLTEEMLQVADDGSYVMIGISYVVAYTDNVSIPGGYTYTFPEKGLYAQVEADFASYPFSLTYGSLKKLDPKYLPDDIGGSGLPPVTAADNGKFLQVVDGAIALVALQDVSKEGM